jgi:hypothetical protein
VHLINKGPSSWLYVEVIEEKWLGNNISYDHLWVFGYESFSHVPKEKIVKIDMKFRKCFSIGYGDEKYGYRLRDPITNHIMWSGDVIFNERLTPNLQEQSISSKEYVILEDITNASGVFKQKVVINQPQPPV